MRAGQGGSSGHNIGRGRVMENAALVLWFLCRLIFPADESPYFQQYEDLACGVASGELCCEVTHIIDRYCCDGGDPVCEDDCTDQQRKDDHRDALRGVTLWCMPRICVWQPNGDGLI